MLPTFLSTWLAFATAALARPTGSTPASPPTEYLFSVSIASGAPVELGDTPAGKRSFQPITGGNFSGPGLQGESSQSHRRFLDEALTHISFHRAGTVVGGLDYGLLDHAGEFNPDVVYLLKTSDGCDILVRERGHAPHVFLVFETALGDPTYDWLNSVVAYGKAAHVAGGVAVDVFKVCVPGSFFCALPF